LTLADILPILHDLPGHLTLWANSMGAWIYVVLFAVVFAETGLIVTPFLPGDSLLFALGALTAMAGGTRGDMVPASPVLDFKTIAVLLMIAANLGDVVNYSVGRWLGLRLFRDPESKVFNPAYLKRTQAFYEQHGGKTIMIARFLPIIRTYAPFVAGLGHMRFRRFALFSVSGGVLWILLIMGAGHFFGNIPQIKSRFEYVILAICLISVLPAMIEFTRARRAQPVVVKTK